MEDQPDWQLVKTWDGAEHLEISPAAGEKSSQMGWSRPQVFAGSHVEAYKHIRTRADAGPFT